MPTFRGGRGGGLVFANLGLGLSDTASWPTQSVAKYECHPVGIALETGYRSEKRFSGPLTRFAKDNRLRRWWSGGADSVQG